MQKVINVCQLCHKTPENYCNKTCIKEECPLKKSKTLKKSYDRGCKFKVRFKSFEKAKRTLKEMTNKRRKKGYIITSQYDIYQCKFCKGFHIGRKKLNKM